MASLDHAVGVEEQRVTGVEQQGRVLEGGVVDHSQKRAVLAAGFGCTSGPEQQWFRMAAEREGDPPAVTFAGEPQEHGGAEAVGGVLVQNLVEGCEHRAGARLADAQRAHRVPDERGDDGGLVALAAHVAEGDDPVVGTDREHVVEVAADLGAVTGRAVGGGQPHSRE